jgi:hypothetical protein
MEKWKTIGICLIGLGILGLAAAVVFFTIEIRNGRQQLPLMLTQTEKTAEKITPAVSGVSDVARFIPPIIEEVTKSSEVVQALLREIKATRESIRGLVKGLIPSSGRFKRPGTGSRRS